MVSTMVEASGVEGSRSSSATPRASLVSSTALLMLCCRTVVSGGVDHVEVADQVDTGWLEPAQFGGELGMRVQQRPSESSGELCGRGHLVDAVLADDDHVIGADKDLP